MGASYYYPHFYPSLIYSYTSHRPSSDLPPFITWVVDNLTDNFEWSGVILKKNLGTYHVVVTILGPQIQHFTLICCFFAKKQP